VGEPYLGEIKIISWGSAPNGWALCDGQLLPIQQNQPLFSLLGTTYGGDGRTTFALPDLRGRVPTHVGAGLVQGQTGGEESHPLAVAEMPAHNHAPVGSSANANSTVGNGLLAKAAFPLYAPNQANLVPLAPAVVASVGGNQPHANMQPSLVLNFVIAIRGQFPSHS
jgi:microcystin-dependent protein